MTIAAICIVLGVVMLGTALRRDISANPDTRLPWWGVPPARAPYNRTLELAGVLTWVSGVAYFDAHDSSVPAKFTTTAVFTLVLAAMVVVRSRHNRAAAQRRSMQP